MSTDTDLLAAYPDFSAMQDGIEHLEGAGCLPESAQAIRLLDAKNNARGREIDRLTAENERLTRMLCLCAHTIPAEFDPDPTCPIHGDPDHDDEPVHGHFGLTYSSYQVLPRVLMQSMPALWQRQMVRLIEQMQDAFRHVPQPECYDVQPAIQVEASSLTEAQRKATGVTQEWEGDEEDGSFVYRDANGDELESWSRVLVHAANPLPPYNRGRTRVPTRRENEAQRAAEATR